MLESLPNLHAALNHFPIGLLLTAILLDLAAVLRPGWVWLRRSVTVIVASGAVLLVPTYLAGRAAGEEAASPFAELQSALGTHADWATYSLWYFLAYAVLRVVLETTGRLRGALHFGAFALLAGGGYLLYETGEHGGELVYSLGVGVRPVQELPAEVFTGAPPAVSDTASGAPVAGEDGSLHWRPGPGSGESFGRAFETVVGSTPRPAGGGEGLALAFSRGATWFAVFPDPVGDLEMDLEVDLGEFTGEFELIHHFRDENEYEFLRLAEGTMALGRVEEGSERFLDRKPFEVPAGPFRLRVGASGRHFRGYSGDEMVVHGHAPALAGERAGFRVRGGGILEIQEIRIRPVGDGS